MQRETNGKRLTVSFRLGLGAGCAVQTQNTKVIMGCGQTKLKAQKLETPASGQSKPRVLCLAGTETTAVVEEVANTCDLSLCKVSTVQEALTALSIGGPFQLLVAALGVDQNTRIFDIAGDRSSLISAARTSRTPPCRVVVYSHTASHNAAYRAACGDAGAQAVISSGEELRALVRDEMDGLSLYAAEDVDGAPAEVLEEAGAQSVHAEATELELQAVDETEYGAVTRRLQRAQRLAHILGARHRDVKRCGEVAKRLHDQVSSLVPSLTLPSAAAKIRFVFCSDTHHHHDMVELPPGDVLLHAGDTVGNYGEQDILEHFRHFLEWLQAQARRYHSVIWVAGNHDTQLDGQCYDNTDAMTMMTQMLPSNVHYLENSGVQVMGVRVWGSAMTPSRLEDMGRRYYSDAFERPSAERRLIYGTIPDGEVDILMTHTPPSPEVHLGNFGDVALTTRLAEMVSPPRFHLFGHDHDCFGVTRHGSTTYLNGAQEEILRMDIAANQRAGSGVAGTGCALEFDIARNDSSVPLLGRISSMSSNP